LEYERFLVDFLGSYLINHFSGLIVPKKEVFQISSSISANYIILNFIFSTGNTFCRDLWDPFFQNFVKFGFKARGL
jgi:hypothetical protein